MVHRPGAQPEGLYLGDYGPEDANPDIGDSAITETAGLGGFAMAAAPAIVRFVGGTVADAIATTRRMYEITLAEHPLFQVPALDFRGTPAGIDATLVARTGILPQINTGMAGKVAGPARSVPGWSLPRPGSSRRRCARSPGRRPLPPDAGRQPGFTARRCRNSGIRCQRRARGSRATTWSGALTSRIVSVSRPAASTARM